MTAIPMKLCPVLTLGLLTLVSAAIGQDLAAPPPPPKNPFVGSWRINQHETYGERHKKNSASDLSIAQDDDDLVLAYTNAASKQPIKTVFTLRCDGRANPAPHGSIVCHYRTPGLIEGMSTNLGEKSPSYWRREVTADGNRMTFTYYKDRARSKVKSMLALDRVP
jgi:hypothetical protein